MGAEFVALEELLAGAESGKNFSWSWIDITFSGFMDKNDEGITSMSAY